MTGSISLLSPLCFVVAEPSRRTTNPSHNLTGATPNGYYIGNFNYNSTAATSLTISNEPGIANTQITIDGAGGGRALSITSSGTSAITVAGLTFSRNCGNTACYSGQFA